MLLAKHLCGFPPDAHCCLAFTRDEWIDAIGHGSGLSTALAQFCLAIGDVPMGTDLSVSLTMDIVWFMARSALVLRWLDYDRESRLDSTNAFPVLPACRACLEMATRRISMDRGLSQDLADAWRALVVSAIYDAEQDTPVNRLIRAELAPRLLLPPLFEGHRPPSLVHEVRGVCGGRRVSTSPSDSRVRARHRESSWHHLAGLLTASGWRRPPASCMERRHSRGRAGLRMA